jgi:signal peptidase I
MKCPSCGLENPPTAQICDCGHSLETNLPLIRKKKRRPFLAAIATFGVFGLGQLYNGKPRKAIVAYAMLLAIGVFFIVAPISARFSWLVVYLALQLLLCLILIVDAVRDARREREINLRWYNRWYLYLALMIIQAFVILPLQVKLCKLSTAAYSIPVGSMKPTIEIGDKLIADMKAYKKLPPQRGDLLIFRFPKDESITYIKRVIGLPGEKLEIIEQTVYINGQPLKESYTRFMLPKSTNQSFGYVQIPENHYFVLGDNRDNSRDSRHFGFVQRSQILGQARYLYWSTNRSRIGRQLN